ncbi:MAG TPA: exodeoxyribonuclease VII large subunit [Rhodocyclaceae bacterium]|nr:exodeoxyribonuclease VII large subunit [Rhodocyclaceae bacterium]
MLPNAVVISIGELNRLARQALESQIPLVWVSGEISNLMRAASGHVYFSLKDATAQARCVMFRSRAQLVPWQLSNGQQVEARALASLYEPRGDFQLNIEALRRAGLGQLFEAFNRLKLRLDAEGLFAAERKRALPRFPRRIGLISSPQAAALRDVLVALRRRAPHVPLVLYPTPVQGDAAIPGLVRAIETAGQRAECDLLLVVRGGGSIEDLWAFNDESVARAMAACPVPIVSGVGHETDVTIADYVADLRAATPTAAAEIASQDWLQAAQHLAPLEARLRQILQHRLALGQQTLDTLSLRLIHPATRLQQHRQHMALLTARLEAALNRHLQRQQQRLNQAAQRLIRATPRVDRARHRISLLAQRLHSAMQAQLQRKVQHLDRLGAALTHLNPQATLRRGFAIVRDEHGHIVNAVDALQAGQTVTLDLADGQAAARILSTIAPIAPIAKASIPD